jgi:putative FmdB family regulatory protein
VPLYEYECRSCKSQFEQLVFNKDTAVLCRNCGGNDVAQLLSVFSVAGSPEKAVPEPGPCGSCGAAQRGACGLN